MKEIKDITGQWPVKHYVFGNRPRGHRHRNGNPREKLTDKVDTKGEKYSTKNPPPRKEAIFEQDIRLTREWLSENTPFQGVPTFLVPPELVRYIRK